MLMLCNMYIIEYLVTCCTFDIDSTYLKKLVFSQLRVIACSYDLTNGPLAHDVTTQ